MGEALVEMVKSRDVEWFLIVGAVVQHAAARRALRAHNDAAEE